MWQLSGSGGPSQAERRCFDQALPVSWSRFRRFRALSGSYACSVQESERPRGVAGSPTAGFGLILALPLVGHSFGGAVAFRAAGCWPALTGHSVAGVMAFGLPAARSPQAARLRLASLGITERWMVTGSQWAKAACWALCHPRPLARALAPYLAPDVPPAVARDGVEHTWRSSNEAFASLVEDADLHAWAAATTVPRLVVQGGADRIATPQEVCDVLRGTGVEVMEVPGDHHLPLRQPDLCRRLLVSLLDRLATEEDDDE
jgi:pimeloyl-ACP methyl ester carboxylesterase